MGHSIITLEHRKFWKLRNEAELIKRIEAKIKESIPGVLLNFTQPIKHNLDHLITGIRADLAVKIYGDDYDQLLNMAEEIKGIIIICFNGMFVMLPVIMHFCIVNKISIPIMEVFT